VLSSHLKNERHESNKKEKKTRELCLRREARYSSTKLWPIKVEFSNVAFLRGRKTGNPVKKTAGSRTNTGDPGWGSRAATLGRGEASNHCAMIHMFHNFSHQ